MVMPQIRAVHAKPARLAGRPAYPQAVLELGNQLRPDRDHPDEQHDRRQCRGFLNECLDHGSLLWNIRGTLFPFCSTSQAWVVGQFE